MLMDGSLDVESELGIGSVFIVNLKNIDIAALSNEDNHYESNIDYSSLEFSDAIVLIVDDVDENRGSEKRV